MIRKTLFRIKNNLWWFVILLVITSWLIYVGENCGLWEGKNCTGFIGKTIWDVLELLIIPVTLAAMTMILDKREREADREIAKDNQREAALQQFYDAMTSLVLDKNLRNSSEGDEIRGIAQEKTLSTFETLNNDRKRKLLNFLSVLDLITSDPESNPIIYLNRVDMRKIDLSYLKLSGVSLGEVQLEGANLMRTELYCADFRWANLKGVNLQEAELKRANLRAANLEDANLKRVELNGTDLTGAVLKRANLEEAILVGANFERADLEGANFRRADLTRTNLEGVQLRATQFENAIMPDGRQYDPRIHNYEYIAANWTGINPLE